MTRFFLISLLSICIYSCANKNNDQEKNIQLINLKYQSAELQKNLLQKAIIYSIKLNGTEIPYFFSFIDCSGDTIALKEYLINAKALILYTGTSFCSSCFEEELIALNQFAEKSLPKKILVLVQNINRRELLILNKKNGYKFDLGIISTKLISDFEFVKNDEPIYFIINDKLILSDFFVPFKNMNHFSEKYFQAISAKL